MTTQYSGVLKLIVSGKEIEAPYELSHTRCGVDANINIRVEYSGKEYTVHGISPEWTDALANLQKALPDDVTIKCCLSCRYGTLCPYGNIPNYVLCSHSVKIRDKLDVIDWLDTVNVDEIERSSFDDCADFQSAGKNHYTYNDYAYYLSEKKI